MSVEVYLVHEAQPGAAIDAGHPALGGLVDLGTLARLDVPEQPVDAAVTGVCERHAPAVRLQRVAGPLDGSWRARLEAQAAERPVVVVVTRAGGDAFVVASGPRLPSMGEMPPCSLALFEASLLATLGEWQEESLFTEPDVGAALDEERLQERLRQLYGE